MVRCGWNSVSTAPELRTALRTLAEEYPLVEDAPGDVTLEFRTLTTPNRTVKVTRTRRAVQIEYTDLAAALRGVGMALAGVQTRASAPFSTFGIMLDCSRNAVMTVSHFKSWLRKLALLGYDMAMLYTEDTYELPGEPYFGNRRGAYSAEELRAVDQYARTLGIEMIPCIQTLGHLSQILKWSAYDAVRDTPSVLLVDEKKTYQLIEKMIAHCARTFRSRRIHIGMDETHDLGRGRFMDRHGYERGFEIFNRHLTRVRDLCRKYDLQPMIWSDMYFRMGSKTQDYYDKACVIPDEVKAAIPRDVQMVYWDYYHNDEAFYREWIRRHRALGAEPLMGSGIWTWATLWYGARQTEITVGPCLRACRQAAVKEIFFTLWGDDGAFCDFDSALAGLAWAAELAYTGEVNTRNLEKTFAAVCRGNYRQTLLASQVGNKELLWDDPLLGIYWHHEKLVRALPWIKRHKALLTLADKLRAEKVPSTAGGDLKYIQTMATFLARKIELRLMLDKAYARGDRTGLRAVVKAVPAVIAALDRLDEAFRAQWLRRNKPFGLEVIQIRFAGQKRRYQELAQRIGEFLAGRIDRIEELENLPDQPLTNGLRGEYRALAAGTDIL